MKCFSMRWEDVVFAGSFELFETIHVIALRGMELTKMSHLPKILTEFVPEWIRDLGDDPEEILKEYKAWGYVVQSIDFPELNSLSEKEFIGGIERHNAFFTNLALIPDSC